MYLSFASKLKLGFFIAGLPSLGPIFCDFSAPAAAMAYNAALIPSGTTWAIISWLFVCLLGIMCICIISAYVYLFVTFTPDTM